MPEIKIIERQMLQSVADPGFLRGGSNPSGGANILFDQFFQNCMKMMKFLRPS